MSDTYDVDSMTAFAALGALARAQDGIELTRQDIDAAALERITGQYKITATEDDTAGTMTFRWVKK